jgi:hypothetical protein
VDDNLRKRNNTTAPEISKNLYHLNIEAEKSLLCVNDYLKEKYVELL